MVVCDSVHFWGHCCKHHWAIKALLWSWEKRLQSHPNTSFRMLLCRCWLESSHLSSSQIRGRRSPLRPGPTSSPTLLTWAKWRLPPSTPPPRCPPPVPRACPPSATCQDASQVNQHLTERQITDKSFIISNASAMRLRQCLKLCSDLPHYKLKYSSSPKIKSTFILCTTGQRFGLKCF